MEQKDLVATALEQVEKEKAEAEISKIKGIIKAYLEKILNKKEQLKELNKELKELEADLDDLKAGRLDKIEEKQGKSPCHDINTLIFIKKIQEDFLPYQPWRSPWIIERRNDYNSPSVTYYCDGSNLTTSGVMFQNFSGGTYDINGQYFTL